MHQNLCSKLRESAELLLSTVWVAPEIKCRNFWSLASSAGEQLTEMQEDLQQAALEAIMDSFLYAMETSLAELLQEWHGVLPAGLLQLARAKATRIPALNAHTALPDFPEAALQQLSALPTTEAVQV